MNDVKLFKALRNDEMLISKKKEPKESWPSQSDATLTTALALTDASKDMVAIQW
ncbi:MAG: hypothetical protein ABJZ55_17755 [Fuerstiella sp.]